MTDPFLVTIEMRYKTAGDPDTLGERIKEAVRLIVGSDALEDFRVRVLPLTPPKDDRHLREV